MSERFEQAPVLIRSRKGVIVIHKKEGLYFVGYSNEEETELALRRQLLLLLDIFFMHFGKNIDLRDHRGVLLDLVETLKDMSREFGFSVAAWERVEVGEDMRRDLMDYWEARVKCKSLQHIIMTVGSRILSIWSRKDSIPLSHSDLLLLKIYAQSIIPSSPSHTIMDAEDEDGSSESFPMPLHAFLSLEERESFSWTHPIQSTQLCLRAISLYSGPLDGKQSEVLTAAVNAFREREGKEASPHVDEDIIEHIRSSALIETGSVVTGAHRSHMGTTTTSSCISDDDSDAEQKMDVRELFLLSCPHESSTVYFTGVHRNIRLIIVSNRQRDERDDIEAQSLRDRVKIFLKNYIELIISVEMCHIPMYSFLNPCPGLVHFVYVDRGKNIAFCPIVSELRSDLADDEHVEGSAPMHFDEAELTNHVRKLIRFGQEAMWEGYYFASTKSTTGMQYSFRMWIEDDSGEEQAPEVSLANLRQEMVSLRSYENDFAEKLCPSKKSSHLLIYELYAMWVGFMSVESIVELGKNLVQEVRARLSTS
eukprot:TRINITY_DN1694_c0_g1_i4.p1 TRINITY_DN1694_c0_g1~~TRINITY_DN1694_c0_g1_i4.p1  ORF type:complete len:536 (-),score=149.25 TRINITY_DN1694_c0_g1_i4:95-1702(-)